MCFIYIPYYSYSTKLGHEENDMVWVEIFLLGDVNKGWLNSLSFDAFLMTSWKETVSTIIVKAFKQSVFLFYFKASHK